jgi:hypothetical protein|tara:strand:+ start:2483 stop:3442 length:960 start_codon:yes stop_codon:yes gene_type:complete
MSENTLNICQVSLNKNIPLIIENYENFKKIYKKINIHIICPETQINEFRNRLNLEGVEIINENKIISFKDFNKICNDLSININYQSEFKERLNWYYQQILKICFAINFIKTSKENLIIWDADTIILDKINFFYNDQSINYGNFFEYHKAYYVTNEAIFKKLPRHFISFLNQFIALSKKECDFLTNSYLKYDYLNEELGKKISEFIIQSIFKKHKTYNGSLFSEYEFIGQSNLIYNKIMQKPMLFLRFGLDGKLTKFQKSISILLGYKHVTYEHVHRNIKSLGMLNRSQSYTGLIIIFFKNFFKFYLRYIKHILMYNYYK